jgi:endo-1,4-beta-xylanase
LIQRQTQLEQPDNLERPERSEQLEREGRFKPLAQLNFMRNWAGAHSAAAGGLLVIIGFALVGVVALRTSSAATYASAKEAESGTTGGNFSQVAATGASGGQFIRFGGGGTTPPPPTPPPGGILLGAAIEPDYLDNTKYAQTLIDYKFDSLSPENAMKFAPLEGTQNQFNFGPADKIVDFAQAHGMRMRGHTLVWHTEVPGWVNGLSNADTEAALQNHIKTVVTHYKGKVKQWDVVNEALDDKGGLSNTIWKQKIGDTYIEKAFKWAREADPDAQLCYNDFGMESAGTMSDGNNLAPKSDAVLAMVKDFKARGVPIDCVGLQTHSYGDYPGKEADLQSNMKRLGDAGVKTEITELDTTGGDAGRYAEIGRACKNSGSCTGVTTWGLDDPTSFRSADNPLLFDGNFNPKPAYAALLDAIGHAKK